jgi:hypothetical protein
MSLLKQECKFFTALRRLEIVSLNAADVSFRLE